jgi:hypothetical protein
MPRVGDCIRRFIVFYSTNVCMRVVLPTADFAPSSTILIDYFIIYFGDGRDI